MSERDDRDQLLEGLQEPPQIGQIEPNRDEALTRSTRRS
jgi:hypothetical protein